MDRQHENESTLIKSSQEMFEIITTAEPPKYLNRRDSFKKKEMKDFI
jgi:hypothetical protein